MWKCWFVVMLVGCQQSTSVDLGEVPDLSMSMEGADLAGDPNLLHDLAVAPDLTAPPSCGTCPTSKPVCGSDGMCRKCVAHNECATGICLLEEFEGANRGICAAADAISQVDNRSETIPDCKIDHPTRDGKTDATAFCDISEALLSGAAPQYYLVKGNGAAHPYSQIALGSSFIRRVVVGRGLPVISEAPKPALLVIHDAGNEVKLVLDGVELVGHAGAPAVSITGSTSAGGNYIDIRRSKIHSGDDAILLGSSFVTQFALTDSVVTDASGAGLRSAGFVDSSGGGHVFLTAENNIVAKNGRGIDVSGTWYSLANNVVAFNGGVGVRFQAAAKAYIPFGFSFNTVADNGAGATAGGVDCGGLSQVIESSIVVRNTRAGSTQMAGSCIFLQVAAADDSAVTATAAPVFVGEDVSKLDFRLTLDPANQACCIDKGDATTVDGGATMRPTRDQEGQPRPQGIARDIGADEVK